MVNPDSLVRLSMPCGSEGRPKYDGVLNYIQGEVYSPDDDYCVVSVERDENLEYYLNDPDVVRFDSDGNVSQIEPSEDATFTPNDPEKVPVGIEPFDISNFDLEYEIVKDEVEDLPATLPEYLDHVPAEYKKLDARRLILEVTAVGGDVPLSRIGYYYLPNGNIMICDWFAVNGNYRSDKQVFHKCIEFAESGYPGFDVDKTFIYSSSENKLGWITINYRKVKDCDFNKGASWYRRIS